MGDHGIANVLQFQRMGGNGANSIRVLGIDPGLNITGYGIIERHGGQLSVSNAAEGGAEFKLCLPRSHRR